MSFSSTNTNHQNHNINNNDNMTNSPLDFVSADVNEVLQEAPQILTNREQRHNGQHSNDQVLDESTTVRVTKQGGDEDPMEVTVLRKKLVELAKDEDKPAREEDQNSSSKKNRDEGNALDSEVCILIIKEIENYLCEGFTVLNLTREFHERCKV
jgi:hypothetical protein